MPGKIILTRSPNTVVAAWLEGRQLVSPGSLAALTWNRPPCTLHDLLGRSVGNALITDQQALELMPRDKTDSDRSRRQHLNAIREYLEARGNVVPGELDGRLAHLRDQAEDYARRLGEISLIDAALPDITLVGNPSPMPLLIHGYTGLTAGQAQWLTALASKDSVIILPLVRHDEESLATAEKLHALGWRYEKESDPREIEHFRHVYTANDRLHEARAALEQAAPITAAGGTVLVTTRVPSDYRTELTLAARELDLPLHFYAMTTPQDTPEGQLLFLVAQTLTGHWAYDDVCALLDCPSWPVQSAAFWSKVRQSGAATQEQWRRVLPAPLQRLTDLPQLATPKEWALALREALPSEPPITDLFLELTMRLEFHSAEPYDQHQYGSALIQALREPAETLTTLPSETVIVAAPEEIPGARADLMLVLGMSDGIWPAPPQFHIQLDAHDRAALADAGYSIRTAVTHARHEKILFDWTALVAPTASVFCPRILHGSHRAPSAFLADLGHEQAPPPTDRTLEPPHEVATKNATFESPPFDVFDLQLSPTQLTRFGQCHFRWYAQHGLRLEELEEPSTTLAPHQRGRLYHLTLEYITQAMKEEGGRAGEEQLAALLEEGFRKAEEQEQVARLPHWRWERAEHLRYLAELLRSPDFLPEGHRVYSSEQPFTMDWHGLSVKGTIDRLDEISGSYAVTDYKTGTSKPAGALSEDGRLRLDVQLPLYLIAASQLTNTPVTSGRYLSLTKRDRRVLATAKPDDAALATLAQEFINAVEQGDFPVRPDVRQQACRYCPYIILCRHAGEGSEDDDE